MPLLILFVAIPLIEIALFIQVGGAIGLGWTLAIVLGTAVLGSWLVRQQGTLALNQLRQSFQALNDPTEPLAHGAMILFSGALLLTPGFFTDIVGFALLVPPVRRWVFAKVRARVVMQSFTMGSQAGGGFGSRSAGPESDVIDGDFEDVSPDNASSKSTISAPSGWTKH